MDTPKKFDFGKIRSEGRTEKSIAAPATSQSTGNKRINMTTAKRTAKNTDALAIKLNGFIQSCWDDFTEEEWMTFFLSLGRVDASGEVGKRNVELSKGVLGENAEQSRVYTNYKNEVEVASKIAKKLKGKLLTDSAYYSSSLVSRTETFKGFIGDIRNEIGKDLADSSLKWVIYRRSYYYNSTLDLIIEDIGSRLRWLGDFLRALGENGMLSWDPQIKSYTIVQEQQDGFRDVMNKQMSALKPGTKAKEGALNLYFLFKAGAVVNPNVAFLPKEVKTDRTAKVKMNAARFIRSYKIAVIDLSAQKPLEGIVKIGDLEKKDSKINTKFWKGKSILSRSLAAIGRVLTPRTGARWYDDIANLDIEGDFDMGIKMPFQNMEDIIAEDD